jgi:hypothetical protein
MVRFSIITALVLGAGLSAQSLQVTAPDALVGIYKFVPEKSTMTGAPATAEMRLTITEKGENLVVVPVGKRADGVALSGTIVVPKAGGTTKAPAGTVAYDTAIVTRIDANTLRVQTMREGKEATIVTLSLSADRTVLRRIVKGVDPKGQPFEGVSVLKRE